MNTEEKLERPTDVPGLVIWGSPRRGYRLVTHVQRPGAKEPKRMPVFEDRRGDIALNLFTRVRDAKAAAARLDHFLPWSDPVAVDQHMWMLTLDRAGLQAFRVAMAERLTGRPIAELEREYAEQQANKQAWADGTGPRDSFNADLTAAGHEVTWRRKGQRTYWGTCSRCKGEFRSSYSSHSRSYGRTSSVGYGYPMPRCTGGAGTVLTR